MKYEGTKIVYEVGDWVTTTREASRNFYKPDVGEVFRITGVGNIDVYFKPHYSVEKNRIRPATQEEINYDEKKNIYMLSYFEKKATEEEKIMVEDIEVKFVKSSVNTTGWIKVGCVSVSEGIFKKIGKKAGWL